MPKGPKGEKRPADTNACAVHVAKIATGEMEDDRYETPNRRKSGMAGAKARMKSTGSERRSQIAEDAAKARWSERRVVMENALNNATCSLSRKGEHVVDVKFFYRPGCTAEDLQAFREKAWAQIDAGVAKQDKRFDSDLLDA